MALDSLWDVGRGSKLVLQNWGFAEVPYFFTPWGATAGRAAGFAAAPTAGFVSGRQKSDAALWQVVVSMQALSLAGSTGAGVVTTAFLGAVLGAGVDCVQPMMLVFSDGRNCDVVAQSCACGKILALSGDCLPESLTLTFVGRYVAVFLSGKVDVRTAGKQQKSLRGACLWKTLGL